MKNYMEFEGMRRDALVFQYVDGVPATEKKYYWNQSPWEALWLFLHS